MTEHKFVITRDSVLRYYIKDEYGVYSLSNEEYASESNQIDLDDEECFEKAVINDLDLEYEEAIINESTKDLNFSATLGYLKTTPTDSEPGYWCASRKGWNGKGMYIMLQQPNNKSKMTRPYLYMCIPFNSTNQLSDPVKELEMIPWLPSQTDILANDWEVFK